jgi:hypothetical protein
MRREYAVLIAAAVILSLLAVSMAGLAGKRFVKAYYDAAPRVNGTVDVGSLASKLSGTNANTYNFIISDQEKDFVSLGEFLPEAESMGIDVWVTILPPSELPESRRYDVAYTDYVGIAERIARLSLDHKNLKAWSIDNVLVDYYFTDAYVGTITSAAKAVNPGLEFIPVVYYPNVASQSFGGMSRHFDGVQFYYTNFPPGDSNEALVLIPQLEKLREEFGGTVILGIYATPWREDYPTSPAYVEQLINLARQHTDGVMIYTMAQEGEKLDVITKQFGG